MSDKEILDVVKSIEQKVSRLERKVGSLKRGDEKDRKRDMALWVSIGMLLPFGLAVTLSGGSALQEALGVKLSVWSAAEEFGVGVMLMLGAISFLSKNQFRWWWCVGLGVMVAGAGASVKNQWVGLSVVAMGALIVWVPSWLERVKGKKGELEAHRE